MDEKRVCERDGRVRRVGHLRESGGRFARGHGQRDLLVDVHARQLQVVARVHQNHEPDSEPASQTMREG